jgi:S1-C subfamily serine protease
VDDILNFSINLKRKNSHIEGLQIGDIEGNALAGELGLKDGDVIVEVNGVPINSLFRCVKACYDAGNSDEVILKIRRENRYVTLKYNLNWEGRANWSTSDVLHSKALSTMLLKNWTGNPERK